MNYDNPAERLVVILRAGLEYKRSESCRAVWERLLDAQGDRSLLAAKLGKLMQLPSEVIAALQTHCPEQGNVWTHWEGQVCAAFSSQNLNSNWETFVTHIDANTIAFLAMSSALLQSRTDAAVLRADQLKEFKVTLVDLYDRIAESDQPQELKVYVTRMIRKIINAVDDYRITGGMPMIDALEATIGHSARDPKYKDFLLNADLGKKLVEILGTMADAVTVVTSVPQLPQVIAALTIAAS